jgi:F-type H+-transporting ATPase subunit delta
MATRGAAARRYAQAVFDLAKAKGTLEEWRADLATLSSMFGNEQTVDALEDPKLTDVARAKIINDVLATQKVSPLAANFLRLLAERRRLALLTRIAEVYGEMYNKEKGIVIAEVTTAIPLDEAHQKRVADQLARLTGKTVQLRTRTDPRILGGVITRIGDELIDASVATRLADLAERLA